MFSFFFGDCLLLGNNQNRFIKSFLCSFKTFDLSGCQNRFGILKSSASAYDMIRRNSNSHAIVTKSQRELTLTKELFILPALVIIKHAHAGKPLGNRV